jgi:alkylation response protein AidB-like acyl-CoA dehydrogenase
MNAPLDRMMDFDLTDDQRLVRQTVRRFAEAEILPTSSATTRGRYPSELIAKPRPWDCSRADDPEEYGGSFTDVVSYG